MNPYSIHAASIQAVINEMGSDCPVFTWGEDDYSVIPGSARTKKDLSSGGYSLDYDLQFTALVAQFLDVDITTVVALKDAMLETDMEYLGDDYKIISVDIAPGGLQINIGANSKNQGA